MLRHPQKILNLMTLLRIVQTGLEAEGQKFLFSVSQKCSKENAVSFNDLLDFIPTLTSLQSENYFFLCKQVYILHRFPQMLQYIHINILYHYRKKMDLVKSLSTFQKFSKQEQGLIYVVEGLL